MIIIFMPLFLMSLFGFLTLRSLKTLSSRVIPVNGIVPVASEQKKKRDIDLLRMVLTEIIVYLILTSAYPLVFLYTTVTANITDKSATRVQIESFVSFISNTCLQYMNHGSRLFIYLATSRIFRSDVKKLILTGSSHNNTITAHDNTIPNVEHLKENKCIGHFENELTNYILYYLSILYCSYYDFFAH